MAMQFFSVFPYLTQALALQEWTGTGCTTVAGFSSTTSSVSFSATNSRFSGQIGALMSSNRGDSAGSLFYNLPTTFATLFAAGSFFIPSAWTSATYPFMGFYDATSPQITFVITPSNFIAAYRASTLLATGTYVVTGGGQWHRFECKVTVNSTTGLAECYVDGNLALSFTGNTQNTANAFTSRIVFAGAASTSGSPFSLCDPIVYDSAGAAPNGYLGDKRFYVGFPTGDGTVTQFTANFASFANSTAYAIGATINDGTNLQRCTTAGTSQSSGTPTWNGTLGGTTTTGTATFTNIGASASYKAVNETNPDDDSSYLSDATVGNEQGFTFGAIPSSVTGIVGVGEVMRSRKDDVSTRSLRLEIKSGASIVDNGTDLTQLSTYQYFQAFFPTDPATSTTWTVAGVNGAEDRVKVTA